MYHNRAQTDDNFEQVSVDTAIHFDPDEDVCRQEFRDDCDILKILSRFGGIPPMNPPQFGDNNFDVDLLTAYSAIQNAETAFTMLPEHIRKAYPDWYSLAAALASGEAAQTLAEAKKSPSGAAEPVPGSADPVVPPAGDTK